MARTLPSSVWTQLNCSPNRLRKRDLNFKVSKITCVCDCFLCFCKGGDQSDEDVDDETMLALDENVSALFAEQQKRIQAKKDEKEKMRKEKILRRDFKIKVGGKYPIE